MDFAFRFGESIARRSAVFPLSQQGATEENWGFHRHTVPVLSHSYRSNEICISMDLSRSSSQSSLEVWVENWFSALHNQNGSNF